MNALGREIIVPYVLAYLRYASALLVLFLNNSQAQDLSFTQFDYTTYQHIPLVNYSASSDMVVDFVYRQQWLDLVDGYESGSLSFQRLWSHKMISPFLAIHGNFDQAGEARYSWSNIGVSSGMHLSISRRLKIGFGGQYEYGSLNLDDSNLRWYNQWTGARYLGTLPTGEGDIEINHGIHDVALGASICYQIDQQHRVILGYGMDHFYSSTVNFSGIDNQIPQRNNFMAMIEVPFHSRFTTVLNGLYQTQEAHDMLHLDVNNLWVMDPRPGKQWGLLFGAGMRFGRSLMPHVGFEKNQIRAEISYDMNLNQVDSFFGQSNGGVELKLRYTRKLIMNNLDIIKCDIF